MVGRNGDEAAEVLFASRWREPDDSKQWLLQVAEVHDVLLLRLQQFTYGRALRLMEEVLQKASVPLL